MGLLLYKSNEMFSSTDLIRKSKMIFNKIITKEIDKAVIMRDGKPGFLLMDFQKYEAIMAEFEELKKQKELSVINPTIKKEKKKKRKKVAIDNIVLEPNITPIIQVDKINKEPQPTIEIIDNTASLNLEIQKPIVKPSHVVPPRPQPIKQEIPINNISDNTIVTNNITTQKDLTNKEEEQTEEDEIKQALDSIKSMNFDDNMKALAEQKIKEKILRAREERAKQREQEEIENKDDLKEELEIQVHIKEENKKKERELREFWD